jgi:hypothetical protein
MSILNQLRGKFARGALLTLGVSNGYLIVVEIFLNHIGARFPWTAPVS